jgi:hypothetical protein
MSDAMTTIELTVKFLREAFGDPQAARIRLVAICAVLDVPVGGPLDETLLRAVLPLRVNEYVYGYKMNALQSSGLLQGVLVEVSWEL